MLGFSRRLLWKVLRPSRKAIVGDPVKEYEVSLCLEYRDKGMRFYLKGPWRVDMHTLSRMAMSVTRWNRGMPYGVGLSLPAGNHSSRRGFCGFVKESGWDNGRIGKVIGAVDGCQDEIARMLE